MKKQISTNKERLIYILCIIFLTGLMILSFMSCDEIVKPDKSKPLSQKYQIVEMIDLKIEYSNEFCEKVALKDLRHSILVRIKDEVRTNG